MTPAAQPPILRFSAAGVPLVALVEELLHLHPPAPLLAVPYAHRALAGLRDDGVPVFDLALLTREPSRTPLAHAVFETALGDVGLVVDKVGTATSKYVLQEDAAAPVSFAGFADQRVSAEGELFQLFSPSAFLAVVQS